MYVNFPPEPSTAVSMKPESYMKKLYPKTDDLGRPESMALLLERVSKYLVSDDQRLIVHQLG